MGAATNLRSISERARQLVDETGMSFSEAVGQILQSIPEKPREQQQSQQSQTEESQQRQGRRR